MFFQGLKVHTKRRTTAWFWAVLELRNLIEKLTLRKKFSELLQKPAECGKSLLLSSRLDTA